MKVSISLLSIYVLHISDETVPEKRQALFEKDGFTKLILTLPNGRLDEEEYLVISLQLLATCFASSLQFGWHQKNQTHVNI